MFQEKMPMPPPFWQRHIKNCPVGGFPALAEADEPPDDFGPDAGSALHQEKVPQPVIARWTELPVSAVSCSCLRQESRPHEIDVVLP
jgi:hypothetical protein